MRIDAQEEIISGQIQWDKTLLHNEQMCNEYEKHAYVLFHTLQASLKKDGNQQCALYGNNLQTGIAGFGDSPHEAILDWEIEMKNKI